MPWTSNDSFVIILPLGKMVFSNAWIVDCLMNCNSTLLKKLGFPSIGFNRSEQISILISFCSSDKTFSTVLAQKVVVFNFSFKMCRTFFHFICNISATVQTFNLRSFRTLPWTFAMFSTIFIFHGVSTFSLIAISFWRNLVSLFCWFLKIHKKSDVNELINFCIRHFPMKRKSMIVFNYSNTVQAPYNMKNSSLVKRTAVSVFLCQTSYYLLFQFQ